MLTYDSMSSKWFGAVRTSTKQMEACNVEVLPPALLADPWELSAAARARLATMAAHGLPAILATLDESLPAACGGAAVSPLLKLALLLSAAAAGTGCTELEAAANLDPEPQAHLRRRGVVTRNQVGAGRRGRGRRQAAGCCFSRSHLLHFCHLLAQQFAPC